MRFATSVLLLVAFVSAPAAAQSLVIRFFDVGQADAALITSPEGKNVLIDGSNTPGWPAYLLDSLHIDSLDLIVATHEHADHIRGLESVLEDETVGGYMDNGLPATTKTYKSLCRRLRLDHIQYYRATERTFQLGTATLRILPLPPGDGTQNNSSVGVLLTYGGFTALFTGDAQDEERAYWETHVRLPQVTMLKVAHHGADNGTDSRWLQVIRPRFAVISVGANNAYHHPAPQTLRLLKAAGTTVYRTDRNGTIDVSVKPDGSFTIRTELDGLVASGTVPPATPRATSPSGVH